QRGNGKSQLPLSIEFWHKGGRSPEVQGNNEPGFDCKSRRWRVRKLALRNWCWKKLLRGKELEITLESHSEEGRISEPAVLTMQIVTGPSLTKLTCMRAPKTPRPTALPISCSSLIQNLS